MSDDLQERLVWVYEVSNILHSTCKRAPTKATETNAEQYPQSLLRRGEDERLNRTDTMVKARKALRTQRRLTHTTLAVEALEVKCHCGKTCKNNQGLKIHQSRTNCGKEGAQVQRTAAAPGETQESSRQEYPTALEISQHLCHLKTSGGTHLMPSQRANPTLRGNKSNGPR